MTEDRTGGRSVRATAASGAPSPGADVAEVSRVPLQLRQGFGKAPAVLSCSEGGNVRSTLSSAVGELSACATTSNAFMPPDVIALRNFGLIQARAPRQPLSDCRRLYSTWDVMSATQDTGEAAGAVVDPQRDARLEGESHAPELSATFAGSGGGGLQTPGLPGIRHAAGRALMYRCPSALLPNRCDRRFI